MSTATPLLVTGIVFAGVLLLFLMVIFFFTPTLTGDQRNIVRFFLSLLAGLAGGFFTGSITVVANIQVSAEKITISAIGGVALFVLTWLVAPRGLTAEEPAVDVDGIRRQCWDRALEAYGTAEIFNRRAQSLADAARARATASAQANYSLADRFQSLARSQDPANKLTAQFQKLLVDDNRQRERDSGEVILEEEKRQGMRAGLLRFSRKCASCGQVPLSMVPSTCGVCGNFRQESSG